MNKSRKVAISAAVFFGMILGSGVVATSAQAIPEPSPTYYAGGNTMAQCKADQAKTAAKPKYRIVSACRFGQPGHTLLAGYYYGYQLKGI